jgi:hypothetical protein
MKSSKEKAKPVKDFEPLALSDIPKTEAQFTDGGFKSKSKEKRNGKSIRR